MEDYSTIKTTDFHLESMQGACDVARNCQSASDSVHTLSLLTVPPRLWMSCISKSQSSGNQKFPAWRTKLFSQGIKVV